VGGHSTISRTTANGKKISLFVYGIIHQRISKNCWKKGWQESSEDSGEEIRQGRR
jgi:hypothetical protein